jgi:D-alanyl-D-alanine carboxypeptidase (penicillin-binding protein 5/6)
MRRRAVLAAALALLGVGGGSAAAATPSVDRAASAIVVDGRDGEVMLQKDPDERRPIASATKLMTALLVLERAKPGQVFTAPAYSGIPAESKIGLREGERMRVDDLLEALLLESANDAAVTIAEGVAGSRSAFVSEMNERAGQIGLGDTSYANPIGLDHPRNYSTARDLARLGTRLMRNRRFARIVDRRQAALESGSRRRVVDNRNKLVGREAVVDGVKTGHTLGAGYVLVGAADQGSAKVVSVVLGEPSEAARDTDTVALLRWGLSRFKRVRALRVGASLARVKVKHRDERVGLVPRGNVDLTLRKGQRLRRRVRAPKEIEGPLPAGKRVGSVALLRDRKVVRRVSLVTDRAAPGAGPLRAIASTLGLPLTLLLLLAMLIGMALGVRRLGTRSKVASGTGGRGAP